MVGHYCFGDVVRDTGLVAAVCDVLVFPVVDYGLVQLYLEYPDFVGRPRIETVTLFETRVVVMLVQLDVVRNQIVVSML